MKKVLGLRSRQKFIDQKIPGLKTRNKKTATKQKGPIGEIYFSTAILFWVKSEKQHEFIFFKINQILLTDWLFDRLVDFFDWLQRVTNISKFKCLYPFQY